MDDALLALRQQAKAWAAGAPSDVRVFVYPPQWEALMLAKLPAWVKDRANEGINVDVVDVGQEFRAVIERRKARERLVALERRAPAQAIEGARALAREAVVGAIRRPHAADVTCRLLINTGSLATIASYSAITNEFHGAAERPPATVIAFPGEGDDRALSMLNLRADANYRVPRV